MSKTYTPAAPDVMRRVAALIAKYHPDLNSYRVKVEVLMVSVDGDGAALMLHGYPCDGIVRATSTKERAAGRGDAEILIDRASYAQMSDAERDALLDHELYHLVVKFDKDQEPKMDSAGRPCLKMRKHDYEVGWFHEIARRHGEASGEVQQARRLLHGHGQLYFAFTENQHELAKAAAPLASFKKMVDGNDGLESVTITSGGKGVKIDKAGIHQVGEDAEAKQDPELISAALDAIRSSKSASVNLLQRRLRIGYNRASSVMQHLERLGVVGPEPISGNRREVLVDLETYKLPEATPAAVNA